MKLASLRSKSRDGQLVVVSKDLTQFVTVEQIAPTMQYALDHWSETALKLQKCYEQLNAKSSDLKLQTLNPEALHAPLPRAYEWVDGSSYINHIMLVRKARNAEPPATLETDPLVYQGGSGIFLGPRDPITLINEGWGCDFESEVSVILGDTPSQTKSVDASQYIKLITLVNDVTLRNLIPDELAKGFGFFNSKPATAFGMVAVTPDELGDAWKDGRVHLPLKTIYNGKVFGEPNAGPDMHFSFCDLIQHITKTRAFTAGTILGSGTVSNRDLSKGSSCIVEKRTIEQLDSGKPQSPYMSVGDMVEIEMFDKTGQSIFGKIKQTVIGNH